MPITEKVVRGIEVSYTGVVDLHDFLDFFKKWFKSKGYDVTEKLYDTKTKSDSKSFLIKWECDRKPTDYDKIIIKAAISGSDIKEAKVDSLKVAEGNVKIEIEGEHEKDYDERWRKNPFFHFIRAIFDKFVVEMKDAEIAKKLTSDCDNLADETKKYFNIKE